MATTDEKIEKEKSKSLAGTDAMKPLSEYERKSKDVLKNMNRLKELRLAREAEMGTRLTSGARSNHEKRDDSTERDNIDATQ
jgi:hypothetical protein